MFVACCFPYLARREVIIVNKVKTVRPGEETLLCTLELKNKDTSGKLDDIHLDCQLYAKNARIEDLSIADCFVSCISRYRANVFINISPSVDVKVTKAKLNLGWKYRIYQNEVRFKLTRCSQTSSPKSALSPCNFDILCDNESDAKLPRISRMQLHISPVSQCSVPPSPTISLPLSFSEYEPCNHRYDSTSYYLTHPQASGKRSSVECISLVKSGVVEAGVPMHFKVTVKDENGEYFAKQTKYQLLVKLGDETIFSGATHKTNFKLTRRHAGEFSVEFYLNGEFIPGNPFYIICLPSQPYALSNVAFNTESSGNIKLFKTQCDAIFHERWTMCSADIVDKYGNRVNKIYDVNISCEPHMEVNAINLDLEGKLHFRAKAGVVGQAKISVKLSEKDSNTDVTVVKDVSVKYPSVVDQFAFGSYV